MARTRIVRGMLGVFGVAVLAAISGCAHVDAYNRGALAHPTMSAEDDITNSMDAHVRDRKSVV